jgi:hypothetical protein
LSDFVIPAKAGILGPLYVVRPLGPRLRGDDSLVADSTPDFIAAPRQRRDSADDQIAPAAARI